jgi:hypothetical protein
MQYKPTLLNISTALYLLGLVIYTLLNFKTLSAEEGWGIVGIIGLAGIGLLASLADWILQQFVRKKLVLNVIGAIVILCLLISFL